MHTSLTGSVLISCLRVEGARLFRTWFTDVGPYVQRCPNRWQNEHAGFSPGQRAFLRLRDIHGQIHLPSSIPRERKGTPTDKVRMLDGCA
jgi:hypothetical protein